MNTSRRLHTHVLVTLLLFTFLASCGKRSETAKTVQSTSVTPASELAATLDAGHVILTWKGSDADEYIVKRSKDNRTFNIVETVSGSAFTYTDKSPEINVTQYYEVIAMKGALESAPSNVVSTIVVTIPQTVPKAPSQLTAVATAYNQVQLDWKDNSNNEREFKVEISTANTGGFADAGTVTADVSRFVVYGLNASTTYYFRIRASNSVGASDFSNVASATTPTAPLTVPTAPSNFAGVGLSQTSVKISWKDNSNNEGAFVIQRSQGSANPSSFVQIGTVAANVEEYTDLNLSANTNYYYRVFAYNAAGVSTYTAGSAATLPPVPDSAPANLAATVQSDSSVRLSWTFAGSGHIGFRVYKSSSGTNNFAKVAELPSNQLSAVIDGLVPGQAYDLYVVAYNSGGDSARSNQLSVITLTAPVAPSRLAATMQLPKQITLTWRDNSDNESGFKIERSDDGASSSFTQIGTVGGAVTTYADSSASLAYDHTYFYRVRASNAAGDSAYSNVTSQKTAVPPPPAPTGLTAVATSNTKIALSWSMSASADFTGFRVDSASNGGAFVELAPVVKTANSYEAVVASINGAYSFRIRAINATGSSDPSNVVTTKTLPKSPTALVLSVASSSRIDLSWSNPAINNQDGFVIESSLDGTTYTEAGRTGAAETLTYSHTNLSPDTTYRYRVKAINAAGLSLAPFATGSAKTIPNPADAPTQLSAVARSESVVRLRWTSHGGNETNILVEMATGSGAFSQVRSIAAAASMTVDITGLAGATDYRFQIRSQGPGGLSPYSNIASATTAPIPPAGAPSNFQVGAVSTSEIQLSWVNNATGTDGIRIQRSKTDDFAAFTAINLAPTTTSFADTGLTDNTTYYYRVRAYKNTVPVSFTPFSNINSAKTHQIKPAKPSIPTFSDIAGSHVTVHWQDNSNNEDGFSVYRKSGSGSFQLVATVNANVKEYFDASVLAYTAYSYAVASYNSGGSLGTSASADVTTLPNVPGVPTKLKLVATTIPNSGAQTYTLSWTPNNGSTATPSYTIRRTDGAGVVTTKTVSATQSVETVTNQNYTFEVRAHNPGGTSSYSNAIGVIPIAPAAGAPYGLGIAVTSQLERTVSLSWFSGLANQTSWTIEKSTDNFATTSETHDVALPSGTYTTTEEGLLAGTTYSYRIRAHSAGGNSAASNVVKVSF